MLAVRGRGCSRYSARKFHDVCSQGLRPRIAIQIFGSRTGMDWAAEHSSSDLCAHVAEFVVMKLFALEFGEVGLSLVKH